MINNQVRQVLNCLVVLCAGWFFSGCGLHKESGPTLRVGVLHSMSGTMAISEQSVVEATLLAIEEVNASGGVLGRKIEAVIADGKSDDATFGIEAERLIVDEKVSVLFGCWSSASRKSVKTLVEQHHHLLFYPVQYEGLEQSPHIVYTGAAPNQQILPAVKWCCEHLGRRVFLVGSDYIFPRAANAIVQDRIGVLGGNVLGEAYIPLGSTEVQEVVDQIVAAQPDVILNTVNGDSNVALFKALRARGLTPDKIPTLSFSIGETELQSLGAASMVGDYAAWNYFQSIDREENRAFVRRFQERYGMHRVVSDPMAAAYYGVYLWCQAVREAGTDQVEPVLLSLRGQSHSAADGIVSIDSDNLHAWRSVYIGNIQGDGQFDIVWSSDRPIAPVPYPGSRTRSQWHLFLRQLHEMWGGRWASPGDAAEQTEQRMNEAISHLTDQLGRHPVLISAMEASERENRARDAETIDRLDREWRMLEAKSPAVVALMTNEAGRVIAGFQKTHGDLVEVFCTDAVGVNMALSNKTSDLFQADEKWWTDTYHGGVGQVVRGDVEFDQSAGIWGVAISVPVYNTEERVVGVIKAFLSMQQDRSPRSEDLEQTP